MHFILCAPHGRVVLVIDVIIWDFRMPGDGGGGGGVDDDGGDAVDIDIRRAESAAHRVASRRDAERRRNP